MRLAILLRRSVAQTWHLLAAAAVVLTAFQVLAVAAAATLIETRSLGLMAALVPAFLQRGFGGDVVQVASFKGVAALGYFHPVIVVMLAVLAMYYASEPAHEVEAGLVDVLVARPVPRAWLLTRSVVLTLTVPAGVVLVMALGTWAGLLWFTPPGVDRPAAATLARLTISLAAVAWCFGGIALALAAGSRRWSTPFGAAVLGSVLLYLVDFLAVNWPVWRTLAWLSPFHYYPGLKLLAGAEPLLPNVAVLLAATLCFVSLAYWRFVRRDL